MGWSMNHAKRSHAKCRKAWDYLKSEFRAHLALVQEASRLHGGSRS
jgi:hypothetical protein